MANLKNKCFTMENAKEDQAGAAKRAARSNVGLSACDTIEMVSQRVGRKYSSRLAPCGHYNCY